MNNLKKNNIDSMPLVSVEGVSLTFEMSYARKFNALDSVKSIFHEGDNITEPKEHLALSGVSFKIWPKDIIGIIGANGSGKSTLLRVISGIYLPDKGKVCVNGRVSTLLSLGTGFDNRLDGVDNIMLSGLLQGMHKNEILKKVPEIVEFADIGDYVYQPLKYYSSGMISRLSFAITLFMKPEILLLDEIFSVGDIGFQDKSKDAMEVLRSQSTAQVLVSHDLSLIEEECNRVIYMEAGEVKCIGKPQEVVEQYKKSYLDKNFKEK